MSPWKQAAYMKGETKVCKILLCATGIIFVLTVQGKAAEGLWQENGVVFCNEGSDQSLEQIVADGNQGTLMLWQDQRNGNFDIYLKQIDSAGIPRYTMSTTTPYDEKSPRAMVDNDEGFMVWTDNHNGNYDVFARKFSLAGGFQWIGDAFPVCTAAGDQKLPKVISDGARGGIVLWEDFRNGYYDFYAQRFANDGTLLWPTECRIAASDINKYEEQIISDGVGGAVIAWDEIRPGVGVRIFAQKLDGNGVVKWETAGNTICSSDYEQIEPQLISDGNGGAIIVWSDQRSGSFDIYAQKLNNLGAMQWTADGVPICTAPHNQMHEQIVTDMYGGAIIAWDDARDYAAVFGQRIDGSGNIQWQADGVPLSTLQPVGSPLLLSDGNGGAVAVIQDGRVSTQNFLVQRVTYYGQILWDEKGLAITNLAKCGTNFKIASDGLGGTVIAWQDNRNGNVDLFAQHMLRPHPRSITINSPAISGEVFHASITGSWFADDRGSVVAATLTRTASADIPFSSGTLNVDDANHLTCDFDLTSASPGDWSLVLTDNLSQSSSDAVTLTIITPTPTPTDTPILTPTPTFSMTETATNTPTKTHSATVTCTPSITATPTVTPTTTLTLTATTTPTNTTSATETMTTIPSPTRTPTPSASATLTTPPTIIPTPTPIPSQQTIVIGHYIYLTDPRSGFWIYDLSNPNQPFLVYSIQGTWRIYVKDHYLYMVDCRGTLYVNDIHDPSLPKEINRVKTGGEATGIDGVGNYVLVADGRNGVAVFDVSAISDICLIGHEQTPNNAQDVQVVASEKRAYVVFPDGSQWSFDLSKYLASPTLEQNGGYATPNPFLPVRGQKAYFNFQLTDGSQPFSIRIYNLRGRLQRTLATTREWDGRSESGHLCEGGAYVYQIEAEGKRVSGKVVLIK